MCVPCLMPDAKLQDPVRRNPPATGVAVPGRVPWPAITGRRSLPNSSATASSPRYAPPVPVARQAAISTQPAEGSAVRHLFEHAHGRQRPQLGAAAQ